MCHCVTTLPLISGTWRVPHPSSRAPACSGRQADAMPLFLDDVQDATEDFDRQIPDTIKAVFPGAPSKPASSAAPRETPKKRGGAGNTITGSPLSLSTGSPAAGAGQAGGWDAHLVLSFKKCTCCGTHRDITTDFYPSQAKCKDCVNQRKSLFRMGRAQKCEQELEKLESGDTKQWDALNRAFAKARAKAKRDAGRVKFSFIAFKEQWQSTDGVRHQAVGEMMWEGEWLEWAKGVKAGHLSQTEAQAQWDSWKNDESVPRDYNGPRGYLRLRIVIADQIIGFSEVAKQKTLERQQKVNKNATADQLKSILGQQVLSHHEVEAHKFQDWGDLKNLASRSLAGSTAGIGAIASGTSALDDEDALGLLGADLDSLLGNARSKANKTGKNSDSENDDEVADGGSEGTEAMAWVDDVANNKAEREWVRHAAVIRGNLLKVENKMKACLADFQAQPTRAAMFTDELLTVQRRLRALTLVLTGSEEDMASYISSSEAGAGDTKSVSCSGSRDVSALARVGPCQGYENLKVFTDYSEHKTVFRQCTSKADIEEKKRAMDSMKALYTVLATACSTAVRDVYNAERTRHLEQAKDQKTQEGKGNKRTMPPMLKFDPSKSARIEYNIFEVASNMLQDPGGELGTKMCRYDGPVHAMELGPLDKPFVASAVVFTDMFNTEGSPLQKEVRGFTDVFDESSQKVAKGRGQRRFADPAAVAEVKKTLQDRAPMKPLGP
jgi:hypothetical protein